MSLQKNTTRHSNGEILTGRLWRKEHALFQNLPFYSNLPRMDEMPGPLEGAFGQMERYIKVLLIVCYQQLGVP
jgi:hypothetical protein